MVSSTFDSAELVSLKSFPGSNMWALAMFETHMLWYYVIHLTRSSRIRWMDVEMWWEIYDALAAGPAIRCNAESLGRADT
jgi:hypothetical protein